MTGFVDIQVNGYAGVDFNSDALTTERLAEVCEKLAGDGVQSFLPTVITDNVPAMVHRIGQIASAVDQDPKIAQRVAGIHVEGPFLSREKGFVGAHPVDHVLDADVDTAMRLVDAGGGLVRLVTLAPESQGASPLIGRLRDEGIAVAAGHTDASLDQLQQAVDAGLTLFTHLGNACPQQMPRHDNIIQRVLSIAQQIYVSFIADGHHVPFFALGNYLRCVPDGNVIIVTDAMSAAGLGPGTYQLAGQEVEVDQDLAAWGKGRENFAGCATTMNRMVELLKAQLDVTDNQLQTWTHANPINLLGSVYSRRCPSTG